MDGKVSITGLDKADVLAALYNAAKPQGMGFMHCDPTPMTAEEAMPMVGQGYFDYLKGRVMKIDISGDDLNPRLYDRDNGIGAVAEVIAAMRATNDTNPEEAELRHKDNTRNAAMLVSEHRHDEDSVGDSGNMRVFRMGLADARAKLVGHVSQVLDGSD